MDNCTELKCLHGKLLEMMSDFDSFCKLHEIDYVLAFGSVLGAVRHKGFIPWDDDLDVEMTRENYDRFLSVFRDNEKYTLQKDTVDYPLLYSKIRANGTAFIEDIPYRKKYRNIHQGIFIDIFPVDKVAKNKKAAFLQSLFSNILISQSLALRGYPKSHLNCKKYIFIALSFLLLPLQKYFCRFVKSFNNQMDFDYYCSFYSSSKKVFHKRHTYETPFEKFQFENIYLPVMNDCSEYLTNTYGDYMKLPSESEREYAVHAKYFSTTEDYSKYLEKNI